MDKNDYFVASLILLLLAVSLMALGWATGWSWPAKFALADLIIGAVCLWKSHG